jgi:hypothetical protein
MACRVRRLPWSGPAQKQGIRSHRIERRGPNAPGPFTRSEAAYLSSSQPCMSRWCVAQTFQTAGSDDFPVAPLTTGLESPVNPQAGKPALRGSWPQRVISESLKLPMNRAVCSPPFRVSGRSVRPPHLPDRLKPALQTVHGPIARLRNRLMNRAVCGRAFRLPCKLATGLAPHRRAKARTTNGSWSQPASII